MSEQLNISRQFAMFIFIHFLGIVFHSLATSGNKEYERQIDLFSTMIEPLIVDTAKDMEHSVKKGRKVIKPVLLKNSARGGEPVFTK
jgi:hypothetical protein